MYECVCCSVVISMCVCVVCGFDSVCLSVCLPHVCSVFAACDANAKRKEQQPVLGKGRRGVRAKGSISIPGREGLGKCRLCSHSWAEQELKTTKIHAAAAAAVRLSKEAKCQHNNLITWSAKRR